MSVGSVVRAPDVCDVMCCWRAPRRARVRSPRSARTRVCVALGVVGLVGPDRVALLLVCCVCRFAFYLFLGFCELRCGFWFGCYICFVSCSSWMPSMFSMMVASFSAPMLRMAIVVVVVHAILRVQHRRVHVVQLRLLDVGVAHLEPNRRFVGRSRAPLVCIVVQCLSCWCWCRRVRCCGRCGLSVFWIASFGVRRCWRCVLVEWSVVCWVVQLCPVGCCSVLLPWLVVGRWAVLWFRRWPFVVVSSVVCSLLVGGVLWLRQR